MLPFLAGSLLNKTFRGHFHHLHGDGGGRGWRGVQGGELGHGILRTFMRDESGGRNKNHTNQDYN